MKVYVVFYDVDLPHGDQVTTERRIDSVYDSDVKALSRTEELYSKYKFYSDFDVFELE